MSGETPAAHLARVKVTYGARWLITDDDQDGGPVCTATERSGKRRITTGNLAELEARLNDAG